MTEIEDQSLAADSWGVHATWVDAHDKQKQIPDLTLEKLRAVIGQPPPGLDDRAPIVTRPGRSTGLGQVEVLCEDGAVIVVDDVLPEDFPLGYHSLRSQDGTERRLIVSPGRCWLPEGWRAWGWTAQLYASRSTGSWGMGDLGDLKTLREWSESLGAGFLLINPLHAVGPTLPQESSPYLPATRQFRNPVYLRISDVPGNEAVDLSRFEARGQALNDSELIERDQVWHLKQAALRTLYEAGATDGFEQWRADQGSALQEFATWCALAQEHGPDWHAWPEELRNPQGAAVLRLAEANSEEVAFHAWLQWLLDLQLRDAAGDLTIIQDLPIGVAGGGSDAWAWQSVIADGVSVGAPPDLFNTAGQDWGSPPLIPWRLREAGYEPFIQSIRRTIAGAGGLRIDHVMGLFRLWWVPSDGTSADGAYVRYPSEDLLDIVALESHRAKAIVVGEDLGTVEPGVREALEEHAILSYRLLWFEEDDPSAWPTTALSAVTTHDLPTVAGLWSGADAAEQVELTDMGEDDVQLARADLLQHLHDLPEDASAAEAVSEAYTVLSKAPSILLSATLEDAIADERRPNIPGVVDRPNWQIPLAVTLEGLVEHPGATALAKILRDAVSD